MTARWRNLLVAAAAMSIAGGAAAQPSTMTENEKFLKAIHDQDANEAIGMVNKQGNGLINYRGYDGTTPLTVAVQKRSILYVNFLLQKGANPDLATRDGDTPLMIAARSGYLDGITTLLESRAKVDATNRQGETALILAVQNHQTMAVRKLLEAGADPSRTDNASGLSAREYAQRDRRSPEMLRLIETVKTTSTKAQGPTIK